VNLVKGRSISQILGYPDDLKFRSSMSLFTSVTADNQIFKDALQTYFGGELDRLTLERRTPLFVNELDITSEIETLIASLGSPTDGLRYHAL
jgi:hypothetical protein